METLTAGKRWMVAILAIQLSACAASQGTSAASTSPACAGVVFPSDPHVGAWSVDKFGGQYLHGADKLTIRRDEHRLLVEGWTLGLRQLHSDSAESWTWADGCGVRYEFTLPPDGPGAWLRIVMPSGSVTDWHR